MIDDAISAWVIEREQGEVIAKLEAQQIPVGRVYDVQDIAEDPHYKAREMVLESQLKDGTRVLVPGIVPKLSETPGKIQREAPELGAHTTETLTALGVDVATQQEWRERGLI